MSLTALGLLFLVVAAIAFARQTPFWANAARVVLAAIAGAATVTFVTNLILAGTHLDNGVTSPILIGSAAVGAIIGGLAARPLLLSRAVAAPRATNPSPIISAAPASTPRAAPSLATPPSDVFISYKREERARVEAMAQALRDLKLSVWFDAGLQSGHAFDEEINREVRGAKCVLVCWSPGAAASQWVRAEADIGRQRGVLAACFLEPCDLYPPFNLVHAEDLSVGGLDGANQAWLKIVDQIGRYVNRPGLGDFAALGADRAAIGAWLADNAHDPLSDVALARLRT